jgi:hypothetical protein
VLESTFFASAQALSASVSIIEKRLSFASTENVNTHQHVEPLKGQKKYCGQHALRARESHHYFISSTRPLSIWRITFARTRKRKQKQNAAAKNFWLHHKPPGVEEITPPHL